MKSRFKCIKYLSLQHQQANRLVLLKLVKHKLVLTNT